MSKFHRSGPLVANHNLENKSEQSLLQALKLKKSPQRFDPKINYDDDNSVPQSGMVTVSSPFRRKRSLSVNNSSDSFDQRLNDAHDQVRKMQSIIDLLGEHMSEMEKENKEKERAYHEMKNKMNAMEKDNERSSINNSNISLDSYGMHMLPLPKRTRANSTLNSPSRPNVTPQQRVDTLNRKIECLKERLEEKGDLINSLNARIRRKENENSILQQQLSDLQNSFNYLKSQYESKISQAKNYLLNLQHRYSKNSELSKDRDSDILHILKENEELRAKVKQLTEKNVEYLRLLNRRNPSDGVPSLLTQDSHKPEKEDEDPDTISLPMSVSYSFNGDTQNSDDNKGFSCFVE